MNNKAAGIQIGVSDSIYKTLLCPYCEKVHIDVGEWFNKPHRTHLCLVEDGGCGKEFEDPDGEKSISCFTFTPRIYLQ